MGPGEERATAGREGLQLALDELRTALRRLEDSRDEQGRKARRQPRRIGGARGGSMQGGHIAREEQSP
jgi:hypothetical protein